MLADLARVSIAITGATLTVGAVSVFVSLALVITGYSLRDRSGREQGQ